MALIGRIAANKTGLAIVDCSLCMYSKYRYVSTKPGPLNGSPELVTPRAISRRISSLIHADKDKVEQSRGEGRLTIVSAFSSGLSPDSYCVLQSLSGLAILANYFTSTNHDIDHPGWG
jgi:hypothetical protein